jgi:hypothetical protein
MDLDSLISQTKALSWENPSTQIESIPTNTPSQVCLPLIGLLISQKTNNNQSVHAALNKAWEFAVPFSFAAIGPNKFLFKFSNQAHIDRIFKQPTWNVNGYLLSLNQWSPLVTMGAVPLNMSTFWVQIHGFPLANLTLKNAAAIGKGMGSLIQVEDCSGESVTFRSYLRILVKLNVLEPLKPGFLFCRDDGEQFQISFMYERLDIYCTSCGRIGHKNQTCLAPPAERIPGKYAISLKVTIFSNLLPPQPSSTMSQPPPSQNTTMTPGEGSTAKKYLPPDNQTSTTINPVTLWSQQPPHPSPLLQPPYSSQNSLEPTHTSNQHLSSLNASPEKQATSSENQHAVAHQIPQISSLGTCSMTAPNASLFPGSISIELGNFNPGPSLVTIKKAHGKKQHSSPTKTTPSPTELPNSSNFLLSPAKNSPSNPLYPQPDLNTPAMKKPLHSPTQTDSSIPPKNPKTHLKKKRHRISGAFKPLKKGPAAPSNDLRLTDDMDTSDQLESETTQPQTGLSFTPPPHISSKQLVQSNIMQFLLPLPKI